MTSTVTSPMTEPAGKFLDTSEFRLHYHDVGEGRPVLLLHGAGPGATAWSNFNRNIATLAASYRVIALDLPGWGRSSTPTVESRRHLVEAAVGLLDGLGIEKAAYVGNSMGGMMAVATAIRFPERVSNMVLMGTPSPGANYFQPSGLSEGLKALNDGYRDPTPANLKRLVQVMCFDPAMATDDLADVRAKAALANPEHLASYIANLDDASPTFMGDYFGLASRIPEITAPTMVIHGRDDRVVGPEHGMRLSSLIGSSRLVMLNRCGHWVQVERADEFNRLIDFFLRMPV
ncbi:alpha/beta hydrolase [Amycolatopsis rhabdoformis]|uniref:Alpha/beta hydrolase n=1 Tax=Amycolatopsis rhabdoformis TaxID=1448059 RepID=A0ABZ1ILY7_9PSEU|nr:alpha/beta hydrolase [Amycolatopsis rhabdoformis]WSE34579.1 alpha/beta hydrolase [Amycolatopsis rhabdoformis]